MKELAGRGDAVGCRDGAGLVGGAISEILEDPCLGRERGPDQGAEGRLVNPRRQRALIRRLQRVVVLIQPVDDRLQREARVEASATGVCPRQVLDPNRQIMDLNEFRAQEAEL